MRSLLLLSLLLAGCATRSLPPYERPLAKTQFQTVRTTAYTHTERDHLKYGARNALGTPLRATGIRSAAADWSRWPAGTVFRILPDGPLHEVDDYGWALAGRNTIDLYMPTRGQMNAWGARRVNIEILRWGDPGRSQAVLRPRAKHRHVKRMLNDLNRMPPSSWQQPEPQVVRAEPVEQQQRQEQLVPFRRF